MTVTTQTRGHESTWSEYDQRWSNTSSAKCTQCSQKPTPEGYDPCIGYVPGATSVCCGHGVEEPYVCFGGRGVLHIIAYAQAHPELFEEKK